MTSFQNIFKIPELRTRVLFTLGMLIVYRVGAHIPTPGINGEALSEFLQKQGGALLGFLDIFSGGSLSRLTIFALGIMPYISASIILQLLTVVIPHLSKLAKEGERGRKKIIQYTRFGTIVIALIQGFGIAVGLEQMNQGAFVLSPGWGFRFMTVITLCAGTGFLMWLGEQIDRFGIGNGVSMIIMAGILTGMPQAVLWVFGNFDPTDPTKMNYMSLLFLLGGFVLVVGGSVILTVAQRRIPVQQAKHTRGRRVYGGQRSYLPLKVNHGGVMPIIFASSLMIFPSVIFEALAGTAQPGSSPAWWIATTRWLGDAFMMGEFPYVLLYVLMVYFFSYFWITVQFNPEEMSKQLRDHGSFIPGLRPGPRTAEYLETVMERITYVGAAFLAVIAVLPMVVNKSLNIDFSVTQFLGGTGLLIVVSVTLDFLQRVEAALLMRNYSGFLSGQEGGSKMRIRGPRG
ncbi:MAG: preprotein translocase subunit SecY [Phycisphaeraceae bacterium]|nr:preprotein translocase subunit SecY [Phycisphaeraceae bacterium]